MCQLDGNLHVKFKTNKQKKNDYDNHAPIVMNLTCTKVITIRYFHCIMLQLLLCGGAVVSQGLCCSGVDSVSSSQE